MPFKASVDLRGLLDGIPEEDLPDPLWMFWQTVAWELSQCINYATKAVEPQIIFNKYRQAGEQYIWEFFVNDLHVPKAEAYNFHGQNVSQWAYAGCVLLQGGRVSTNH